MLQGHGEYEGPIQESLFGLSLTDLMAQPVLVRVPRVPLEALQPRDELVEDAHAVMYMIILYDRKGQRPRRINGPIVSRCLDIMAVTAQ